MIVALLLLGQMPLSLPGAYYTLDEVAADLRKQQISVQVAPSVSDEVFAIRSEKASWELLRQALVATGRISIIELDGTWKITRSEADKSVDSAAARRFVEVLRSKVEGVYGGAVKMAFDLAKASDEELDWATEKLGNGTGKSPEVAARDQLVYLVACEHDRGLQDITIPWLLATNKADPFGRIRLTDMWLNPQLVLPDGDIRNFRALGDLSSASPEELRRVASGVTFGGKLTFEPLTLSTTCRVMFHVAPGQTELSNSQPITPAFFQLKITPEQVWSKADLAAIRTRWSHGERESAPVTPSVLPLPTSESILRWAEINRRNIVLPVSSMADLVIPGASTRDLPEIVEANNSMNVDGSWLNELASERVDARSEVNKSALQGFAPLAMVDKGGFLAFRNDLDFLDELSSGDPSPTTEFLNLSMAGKKPDALDVCRTIAKIPLSTWRNGRFANGYLRYCNPVSFRPFAAMLLASKSLSGLVHDMANGEHIELNLSEIEGGTAMMQKGAAEAGELNDAINEYALEPSSTARYLQTSERALTLKVDRLEGTYVFGLYHDDQPVWLSWIRQVEF